MRRVGPTASYPWDDIFCRRNYPSSAYVFLFIGTSQLSTCLIRLDVAGQWGFTQLDWMVYGEGPTVVYFVKQCLLISALHACNCLLTKNYTKKRRFVLCN